MDVFIKSLLEQMRKDGASDLHITVGLPPIFRVNGDLHNVGSRRLMGPDTKKLVESVLSNDEKQVLYKNGEVDLCISDQELGRYRINAFVQRGSLAMAIRRINYEAPGLDTLGLPDSISKVVTASKGLFLVTGPTGSGKSTTLASIIAEINKKRRVHIITLEDPIEYLHRHDKSIVNQREIGADTKSYANALRAALREDPDVILIGEMRDLETISIALTAAETGHLVLSTIHTIGATKTIERIVDVFSSNQQQQIKMQLTTCLLGVLSQILIPTIDGNSRALACELMWVNSAIKNLIRESKTHQIPSIMQLASDEGMILLDKDLIRLYKEGLIDKDKVFLHCSDYDTIKKEL